MKKMKCLTNRKTTLALAFVLAFGGVRAQSAQDTLRLTLNQALEIALNDNPTIKVADQEITLKKTANREAYAGLLPEVSLVGGYQRAIKKQSMAFQGQVVEIGIDNTYNGGLNISLPIFAPALYKSISLTKSDVDLAVEKARSSKISMVNQVTKAYYQLLLAQDSHVVLKKSYDQAVANYNVVNAKYEQGSVSEYDKIRAEVQMRNLVPTVVSARNGVNLARLQLKVLMGMDPDIEIAIIGNLKDYELTMFQQQLDERSVDLSNNSDLKQLDLNAELLKKSLKLKQTNFMPTLGASFNYTYMSMNENFRIAHYDWYPYSTLGLSLTIPLFKASNFTTLKQTKIQMYQLTETKTNAERQLQMQATSYLDNMNASTEQVVSNKESVHQAEKGREIAKKRYEVGKGTILELNDSEVALTQAELTYNQSIFDYLTAKADLDQVLGAEPAIK
ncbi:TolC family protein [Bacteroides sp. 51]|uniref:TolC family protein n=1 Tax=Bacteroides sp. 51 TaxID=2302938 RepID=UPI0013D5C4B1|nr:TolC family protein [Bacteroides sp. 51]NDV82352.1 TolC family protein [Bacteroides sp. 51]